MIAQANGLHFNVAFEAESKLAMSVFARHPTPDYQTVLASSRHSDVPQEVFPP
jgi:hypothetical protein